MKNGVLIKLIVSSVFIFSALHSNTAFAKHIFGIGHIKIDPIVLVPFVGPTLAAGKGAGVAGKAVGEVVKVVDPELGKKILDEVAAYENISTEVLKATVKGDVNELLRLGITILSRIGILGTATDQLMAALYREYISKYVNDPGSQTVRLHPDFIALYQDDFKEDLRNVTLKVSKLNNTSLTDCKVIHFKKDIANTVFNQVMQNSVSGTPFPSSINVPESYINLMLHELEHVDQCLQLGGRDNYAANWFYNLIVAGVLQPAVILFTGPVGAVAYLGTVNGDTLHDAAPFEIKAKRASIIKANAHINPHAAR